MSNFSILCSQETKLFFKKKAEYFVNILFMIVLATFLIISLQIQLNNNILNLTLASIIVITCFSSHLQFKEDFDDGTIEQYITKEVALYEVLAAKISLQFITNFVPAIIANSILCFVSSYSFVIFGKIALIFALCLALLSIFSNLVGLITAILPNGSTLGAIIAIPFMIAVSLVSHIGLEAILSDPTAYFASVKFLTGILLLFMPMVWGVGRWFWK